MQVIIPFKTRYSTLFHVILHYTKIFALFFGNFRDYHKHRLYTIRTIIRRWAPESENNTEAYINNVSKLTGILPDEPLGIPAEQPARWIALGAAMAIQENGTSSLDYFAMLRGWEMCRQDVQSGKL